ncbi:MAG: VTT domain-containing protein [Bifidobacteriaceae bacterium]|jgi:hypothetical protein|nr:VTT domain-containing protein [Bifidobacteriaceae bacterium]
MFLNSARRSFAQGATQLMIIARFIPAGRTAMNLTAGAIGFPLRRFALIDLFGCACWAAYAIGIGCLAGQVASDNPLFSVSFGIAFGTTVGTLVQWLVNRRYGRLVCPEAAAPPGQAGKESDLRVAQECQKCGESPPSKGRRDLIHTTKDLVQN